MYSINKLKKDETYSIIHYTGFICILLGLLMLVPVSVALIYGEYHYIMALVGPTLISSWYSSLIQYSQKPWVLSQLIGKYFLSEVILSFDWPIGFPYFIVSPVVKFYFNRVKLMS